MILIVDLAQSYGGAEVRVLNTMREISGKQACGAVVLEGSPLHDNLLKEDITVYPLPYRRSSVNNGWAIRRIIRENNALLVDTQNVQSHLWGLFGTLLSKNTRLLVTAHNSKDTTVPYLKNFLHELVLRICSWTGNHFVAVSNSVQSYLTSLGVSGNKVHLISNGLPIERMVNSSHSGSEFWKSIGWNQNNFVVSVVGRLESIKGHRYLLEALPEIINKYPHVRCCIVGTGHCETDLRNRVESLHLEGHVYFAGFRNDVAELLVQSDLLCMPSLSEGLPFTLLEACIYRVPIVASRVGGIPEFLEDKKSALLVDSKNSSQIAKAIITLVADLNLAKKLSENAFEVVCERYDLSNTINKTLGLYDRMTAENIRR